MSAVQTQTRPTTSGNSRHDIGRRVRELLSYVQQGRIIDAMYEFYDPGVSMQENNNPPTVGLEANVERERQFVASVRTWKGFTVGAVGVDEERGHTLVQSRLEFESTTGAQVTLDQVAVQTWRDGKIVHEKFYYDTGAAK